MSLDLTILYRGPLASCNYDCGYCPFAKQHDTAAELRTDRHCLARLVDWLAQQDRDQFRVMFTPWGEALTRSWYRDAMVQLSHMPNIRRVVVQTNLSCDLQWLDNANRDAIALWSTYHPSQVRRADFLNQCRTLDGLGVRYSVGTVGLREDIGEICSLRKDLPPHVYLWVNAYKRLPNYYSNSEREQLRQIDPLFEVNNVRHPSAGKPCRAGESVISVDGDGTVRRCHFIDEPIGNLYEPEFAQVLRARPCSNQTCGCHIGYVHRNDLPLYEIFGDGVVERIPRQEWKDSHRLTRWVAQFAADSAELDTVARLPIAN